MLDDRVLAVMARLEREDAAEREQGVARELRARQVAATTGRFLFSLVAPQADCEVLEIGGSRGYSTLWLAAGARHLGGRVISLEHDPRKAGFRFVGPTTVYASMQACGIVNDHRADCWVHDAVERERHA